MNNILLDLPAQERLALATELILSVADPFYAENVNLQETPQRVASAYLTTWFSGYDYQPDQDIKTFPLESTSKDLVMVKDIQFYSMCAHHLAPFMGKAAIGYIPNQYVLGLSKVARVLEGFTRRLQLQEAITAQVADTLMEHLQPYGCMVVLYDVEHTCMTSRGVKAHSALTTTSAVRGIFETDSSLRSEFLSFLK